MTAQPTPNYSKTVWKLVGVVSFMLALGFASVPLYDLFCRVTGYGGTTQLAQYDPGQILDREVTVRFDASTENGFAWEFEPLQKEMTVRLGETALALKPLSCCTSFRNRSSGTLCRCAAERAISR